jgi:hypothetical protein
MINGTTQYFTDHGYVPLVVIKIPSFHSCFITSNKSNKMGTKIGPGTVYPFGATEFPPDFSGVRVPFLCSVLWIILTYAIVSCPSSGYLC